MNVVYILIAVILLAGVYQAYSMYIAWKKKKEKKRRAEEAKKLKIDNISKSEKASLEKQFNDLKPLINGIWEYAMRNDNISQKLAFEINSLSDYNQINQTLANQREKILDDTIKYGKTDPFGMIKRLLENLMEYDNTFLKQSRLNQKLLKTNDSLKGITDEIIAKLSSEAVKVALRSDTKSMVIIIRKAQEVNIENINKKNIKLAIPAEQPDSLVDPDPKEYIETLVDLIRKNQNINHQFLQALQDTDYQAARGINLRERREKIVAPSPAEMEEPDVLINSILSLYGEYHQVLVAMNKAIVKTITLGNASIRTAKDIDTILLTCEVPKQLSIEPVEIRRLIQEALNDNIGRAKLKKQDIFTNIEKDIPVLNLDPKKIMSALNHLIDNAIKYSPIGKSFSISARYEHSSLYVEVIDFGPGLDLNEQNKAFLEATTLSTKPTGKEEKGDGMGLYWVQKIAKEHGGNAYVKSEVGKGSTFGFVIPSSLSAK